MNGRFSARVTPLITSAINKVCFSLSMTHGPAIRNRLPDPMRTPSTWKEILISSGRPAHDGRFSFVYLRVLSGERFLPAAHVLRPVEQLHFGCRFLRSPLQPVLVSRSHESLEQRMRLQRLGFELGMKLAPDEMRMVRKLHDLDIRSIRR